MEENKRQLTEGETPNGGDSSRRKKYDKNGHDKLSWKRWSFWERVIKVVSALGSVIALIALLLIISQLELMREQNRAAWYTTRPDIYVMPITHKDLVKYADPKDIQSGPYKYSYTLLFTIRNVGKSPAIIDSINTEYIFREQYLRVRERHNGRYLPQGIESVENMSILLDSSIGGHFAICIKYKWDNDAKSNESFAYRKFYAAHHDGGVWHFYTILPDSFAVRLNEIPDSLKCEYRDSEYHQFNNELARERHY